MKYFKKNKSAQLIALLLFVVVMSSCNRGAGCPSQFDLTPIFSFFFS
jgi:hypothetical protein